MMRSDSLRLHQDLTFTRGDTELHDAEPGQALIRIEFAGVCGSDLHVMRTGDWVSMWPAVLGHEIIGVVHSCPGGEFIVGDRVVVDSRVPCGDCEGCNQAPNLCSNLAWVGEIMPGGYQTHALFSTSQLVHCPANLEAGIGVLAEPLAVAMHGVSKVDLIPDSALILGYGPIGALVHSELRRRNPSCSVTVCEPEHMRQQMASAFGAITIGSLQGDRWPLVVDAAGYATSLADAVNATSHGGTVLAIAIPHMSVLVDAQGLVERSISLFGSVGFDDELPLAIRVLSEEPDSFRPLVTEAVLLDDAAERLATLSSKPAAGKVVIRL
jgi:threonine dehydrogenase-like Zn-dependent dehydrogenase